MRILSMSKFDGGKNHKEIYHESNKGSIGIVNCHADGLWIIFGRMHGK
jgi:hypothetical protein